MQTHVSALRLIANLRTGLILLLIGLAAANGATTRTWDGNGDSNASGNWATAANWSGDDVPDTGLSAGETASLPDVAAAGTRTVTNNASHTIYRLQMTQSTAGGVNKLLLNGPLTLSDSSGNANPFSLTAAAGVGSLVVDLNGYTLKTTASGYSGISLAGTWELPSGSDLEVEFTGSQSHAVLTNSGSVSLDGATLTYDWAASANNSGSRNIANAGTMVLENGSAVRFASSMGRPAWVFQNNTNSGTLRVLSNSTFDSINLTNTGTLELGSGAVIGGIQSNLTLTNRGALDITGDSAFRSAPNPASSATLLNDTAGTLTLGTAGSPADFLIQANSPYLTNRGTATLEPGSTITLQIASNSGGYRFDNSGTFVQDDVDLIYDWAITSGNNGSPRDFINSGTWTLRNASTLAFISSTGWNNFGYGTLSQCSNSGALTVESGSSVAFRGLTNTGTITLGAGAELGTNTFVGGVTLTNGTNGSLVVAGSSAASPARIGFVNSGSGSASISTNGTGAALTVGTGSDAAVLAVQGNHATVANTAGNTLTVEADATLRLDTNTAADGHNFVAHNAQVTNSGQLTLAGQIELNPNHQSTGYYLDNSGLVAITGDAASVERLKNRSTGYDTQFYNRVGGTVGGVGTLTYINSTGDAGRNRMILTNAGTLAPGNSIGTLEFVNTNVQFPAGGIYEFEAASASDHDLTVLTDGNLTLADGWVLRLIRADGYSWPGETFTLFTVDGGSISLGTASILFEPASKWGGTPALSVVGHDVILSGVYIIPEPSAAALLAAGLLALRRRYPR
ncbi:MAG: hypothetical protein BWZ02_02737 [Lentisphaerae bacterium ADurb.BinA184]|nr:MAG: hypothetical protein BWZ02_02737 [Lentisphaerae bacterium ADurb.BinA184]